MMARHLRHALLLMLCSLFGAAAADTRWRADSLGHRSSLLELYTSEGCSSCPPADRWIRSLGANGFAPSQIVVLAFHVDYWDYLGWKDPFAQREFSARQRDRARQADSQVYTPQFFVNGQSSLNTRQILREVRQAAVEPASVNLTLDVQHRGGALTISPRVEASANQVSEEAQLFIAVYENGLVSEILDGENKGRVLQHDFVVRHLHGPVHTNRETPADIRVRLGADWDPTQLGVAAFVQDPANGHVLQALDLRLTSH